MAKHRSYKTVKGAKAYCDKLNAQLHSINEKRISEGKSLSSIDFYSVHVDEAWKYCVMVWMQNGKQYLCA